MVDTGYEHEERIIDLDDFRYDCGDPVVTTLQILVEMHNESHRRWRWSRENGVGAGSYVKA